jgi:hypothetical protein
MLFGKCATGNCVINTIKIPLKSQKSILKRAAAGNRAQQRLQQVSTGPHAPVVILPDSQVSLREINLLLER